MIDILILIAVALGIFGGFSSGLVRQVIGLAGVILAIVLSMTWAIPVGEWVVSLLELPGDYAGFAGFLTVFLGVWIIVAIISRAVMSVVKALKLSGVNRVLGAVFGGAKMFAIAGVVLVLLSMIGIPPKDVRAQSTFYAPLVGAITAGWAYLDSRVEGLPELPGSEAEEAQMD